jgi:hypothetical protein
MQVAEAVREGKKALARFLIVAAETEPVGGTPVEA